MKQKISVIMSVYNESQYTLQKAIESICQQTLPPTEYIIVVDNPNNVEAISLIKNYQINTKTINIKLIINEQNLGLVESLNKALYVATGYYIARMDADDISEPTRLQNQLDFLTKNNLDFVGSYITTVKETGEKIKILKCPRKNAQIIKCLKLRNCMKHPTWFLKKEVYDKLNGYRNIHTCEDYDFVVRAVLNNIKMGNVDIPCLKYTINNLGISKTNEAKQQCTMEYIAKKYKRKEVVNIRKMNDYLESPIGKKNIYDYEQYYYTKQELVKEISNKNWKKVTTKAFTLLKNPKMYKRILTKFKSSFYC